MTDSTASLKSALSMNRAEELGYDVWQHFVIPPFYDRLDLQTARKPRLIIGGRGCGKTMLLRYLSHQSMFSPLRPEVPEHATSHIGLFWRTDTHFASLMSGRNIPDDTWDAAFTHMAGLILGIETLESLRSLANSKLKDVQTKDIEDLDFSRLQAFDADLPCSYSALRRDLEERLWRFESWVSNVRKMAEPAFLPGQKFLLALVKEIQGQLPCVKESRFFVYVDEYENLRAYQQRIINTWLKHSESPLIFNIAMKRNSFETLETTGTEALSDIHDFRPHDLEEYILEADNAAFFAEILFLELSIAGIGNSPVEPGYLRDPTKLSERRDSVYIQRVLSAAQMLFPDVSHENLARGIFAEPALSKKLRENIERALKRRGSSLPIDNFYRPEQPQASIVTPALLYRKGLRPELIAEEMIKLVGGEENRFTGPTDWTHNNFIGSLLQLYEPYQRACPFYAGFRTFLHLSRGNIRHFLELCYKSLSRGVSEEGITGASVSVSPSLQAEAARQASTAFLREIRSFGPHGNQLHTFVLRLGWLFALAHQRPTLSESEQSHFSVGPGSKELTVADHDFLREAVKWSVLFEEPETKTKTDSSPVSTEYVLNPIYAPYFHISYRKKRKLELRTDDVILLMRGSYSDVRNLIKRFSQTWSVDYSDAAPTLFSHLTTTGHKP